MKTYKKITEYRLVKITKLICVISVISGLLFASVINVPADQPTIQAGIDSAVDGDTVLVANGTYIENINFNGKNIVVTSVEGAENTIIDGNQNGSVVTFENSEDDTTVLDGFTIRNGLAEFGGGIYCSSSNPILTNLMIEDNSATCGGGIHCSASSPKLRNNVITHNEVAGYGGGIECDGYSSPILVNTTICGNSAGFGGGGIDSYTGSSPRLVNSILWGNTPQQIFLDGGYTPAVVTVAYSNIQGGADNIGGDSDCYIINWLGGNIDIYPLFNNLENGDYTLQPNSPCIDVGTSFFVFEGDTLVNMSEDEYIGFAPDMGAFEYESIMSITEETVNLPNSFHLFECYPNPFNPSTTISFQLPQQETFDLSVYNIKGELVEVLFNKKLNTGYHQFDWKPNSNIPSGSYFVKLSSSNYDEVSKIVYLK